MPKLRIFMKPVKIDTQTTLDIEDERWSTMTEKERMQAVYDWFGECWDIQYEECEDVAS